MWPLPTPALSHQVISLLPCSLSNNFAGKSWTFGCLELVLQVRDPGACCQKTRFLLNSRQLTWEYDQELVGKSACYNLTLIVQFQFVIIKEVHHSFMSTDRSFLRNQVPLSISHVLHTIHATDKHRMQKMFQKNDNAMPHENSTMLLEQKKTMLQHNNYHICRSIPQTSLLYRS